MTLIRLVLIVIGCLCLVLGTLGVAIPVLPTVPFYLLATLCFAKSSRKLHDWFTGTELYKKNLESYMKGQGMTVQTKCRITLTITLSMALGFYLTRDMAVVQLVLAAVWLGLMVYFFAFVKTQTVK